MTTSKRIWEITKKNLKHQFLPNLLLTAALLLLTPIMFGLNDLDEQWAVIPLEMAVALSGILLMTPIYLPEQDENTHGIIRTKKTSLLTVQIIRTIYSLISLIALIGIFVLVMSFLNSKVNITIFIGTLSSALFLGSLGMIGYSLFHNAAVAYMLPMMYYLICLGGGDKLGKMSIIYMSSTRIISAKPIMLIIAIVCIIVSLFIDKHRK